MEYKQRGCAHPRCSGSVTETLRLLVVVLYRLGDVIDELLLEILVLLDVLHGVEPPDAELLLAVAVRTSPLVHDAELDGGFDEWQKHDPGYQQGLSPARPPGLMLQRLG